MTPFLTSHGFLALKWLSIYVGRWLACVQVCVTATSILISHSLFSVFLVNIKIIKPHNTAWTLMQLIIL